MTRILVALLLAATTLQAQDRSAVYTGRRVIDRNHDPKDLGHLGGYAGHVTGVGRSPSTRAASR